jgi:hypothetical protein
MTEVTEEQLEDIEALFVQTASGFSASDASITLQGVSASTLYFADRPQREVGHMSTQQFVDLWGDGDNSFEVNPPNAVLSFLASGDTSPVDAVVVIRDPRLDGDSLAYDIDLLEGQLPTASVACTLFIDPFGRPLSPVSAAGMHRRARRRRR